MKSSILAILIVCLFLQACSSTHHNEQVLQKDLMEIRVAIDKYYQENGHNPESLEEIVKYHYLKQVPIDPFTQSASTWVPEFENGRVVDVHSGTTAVPQNKKPYNQW